MLQQTLPVPFFQARTGLNFRAREPKFNPYTVTGYNFLELYCQANGSNLNSGTDNNSSPRYSSTNGNWNATTFTFTPSDGSNPLDYVTAGDWASIYNDGASVGVYIVYVKQVTSTQIICNGSLFVGVLPTTSATGRSIRVGGAWLGPNGSSVFPFNLVNFAQNFTEVIGSGRRPCINMKNDQIYSITTGIFGGGGSMGRFVVWGYSETIRDGGRATIQGPSSGTGFNLVGGFGSTVWVDMIFDRNGNTGSTSPVGLNSFQQILIRCTFSRGVGPGITTSTFPSALIECEAWGNNTANNANMGGFYFTSGGAVSCINCYSHDNACTGFYKNHSDTLLATYIGCIADSNKEAGFNLQGAALNVLFNCDAYNNGGDGIILTGASQGSGALNNVIYNTNLIKNRGYGINFFYPTCWAEMRNNGFGTGSMANLRGAVGGYVFNDPVPGVVKYPANFSPYNDVDNGDFSLVLPEALSAGRGVFTQGGGKSGTVSYPDIGAAQAPTVLTILGGGDPNLDEAQTLPFGYVGFSYVWRWYLSGSAEITVVSGSLPPGLTLSQPTDDVVTITGTPTLAGQYPFTLRVIVGDSYRDSPFKIHIEPNPSGGGGFASGF